MAGDAKSIAEIALFKRYGVPVRLDLVQKLTEKDRRNQVSRYRVLDGPAGLPPTVIVKLRQGEERSEGLLRDIAVNRLLTDQTNAGVTPALLAWDYEAPLIVIEDLGDGESLVETLQGDGPNSARRILLEAASVLGRLHGSSARLSESYGQARVRRPAVRLAE